MFCPYCGCKVDDGFKFCPKCGDKLQTVEPSAHAATSSWMQRGNVAANGTPHRLGTDKQAGVPSGVRGWFRRFAIAPDASAWKCAAFFAIGIAVCWVGWVLVDVSTGLDAINLRTSAYHHIHGCDSPNLGEWLLFLVGAAIDLAGIGYAYYAWTELLDRIKRPSWNMPPPVAKTIAVVVCAVFFCLFILILAAVKGTPSSGQKNMCVWDYLIMIAGFKAIWRFFVGVKPKKEMSKQEIEKAKRAGRNSLIRIFVYLAIGIIAAIIICWSLCRTADVDDSKALAEPCDTTQIERKPKRISDADISKPRKANAKIRASELKDRATPEAVASAVAAANKKPVAANNRISAESLKDPRNQRAIAEAIAKAQREGQFKDTRTPEEKERAHREIEEQKMLLDRLYIINRLKKIRDAESSGVISVREARAKIRAFLEAEVNWPLHPIDRFSSNAWGVYKYGPEDLDRMSLDEIVESVAKDHDRILKQLTPSKQ